MIVADLDAATLARMTIRPSPVHEVIGWLRLVASGDRHPVYGRPGASDRAAFRDPGVALVVDLVAGRAYQPDLLTPVVGSGSVDSAFRDQLDAVAAADPARTATEVAWTYAGCTPPTRVRAALDRGDLGRVAARGLATARRAMGDRWASVAGRLERSTHEAAATVAREGVGAVLDGMHRDVRWTVSQHLGTLSAAGLLVATRRGRHVDYRRSARGDLFLT